MNETCDLSVPAEQGYIIKRDTNETPDRRPQNAKKTIHNKLFKNSLSHTYSTPGYG